MKWWLKCLWLLALLLALYGSFSGGAKFIWSRASSLCLSCMGLQ